MSLPAPTIPRWALVWFAVTAAIVTWDVGFVLLRPASLPGGSMHWLWVPYDLYLTVDRRYAEIGDDFVVAQSWMNLVEVGLALLVLRFRARPVGLLLAFAVALMTTAKTTLFGLTELASGCASIGHAPLWKQILLFWMLNGIWVVVPASIVVVTGRRILARLRG